MKIIISKKFYNGDYEPGSILEMIHKVKITPLTSTVNTKVAIITGRNFKERTNIEFSSALSLTKDTMKTMQQIILKIKSLENVKEDVDKQCNMRFSYTNVKIDNYSCKILSKEPLLIELLNLLNCSFNEMMVDGIREKLYEHCKFVWQSGDIKIGRTQCEICGFYSKDSKNRCKKYTEIPKEIIESKKKCEYMKTENTPW